MPSNFLKNLAPLKISNSERAIALVWYAGLENHVTDISVGEIASIFEAAGYPRQNQSRIREALSKDRRTTKTKDKHYRINVKARAKLDETYLQLVDYRPINNSSSVVDAGLFKGTRAYIEKVVAQLNAAYDGALYDCCAVMCRRLLETLIIEVYESRGEADTLKNGSGHFHMFSGLKAVIESDQNITLSRNTLQGLNDFKKLGDLSAHSRRFNARKNDIDKNIAGIRVAGEEFLHLADLI
ncbi:hypothetical protein [Lacimicrobium alkaliphilum]|uniref:DUF4145 domain-containing protein n=1 Tax=Lacimicrobium alkaliphilum TaxID=1526571 RepID=A0ABQ1RPW8_9ALTE|nr:hypothetical protein [Lacimicrobium alkaliphilum]GGD74142.1 hypothetical protein GCM10011357_31450 [Lacimicrobium alkaliphilum]